MVAMKDPTGAALAIGRLGGWEPLGFEAGDNNWYRFVANGPTEKTDPWGLSEGQWHHMIPQNGEAFRTIFHNWGLNIDAAEFGRIMTAQDHSRLHAAKVGGKSYLDHWKDFVAKGKPTQAQLNTFLKTIEKDFAGYLKNAYKTKLSFQDWGSLSTELKDAALKAKQTGRACVVLKRAGVAVTIGTFIYNANSGGVVFAADQAAKDLVFYDELDPLLKYAAHSASTRIVTVLTGRPDGLDYEVNRCRCLQCRKLPDNCRCEGGPLRP
jgi:hypothetical protein